MNTETAFEIAGAVLLSLGGGGVIVLGCANWLGKIWANRLMSSETAKHNQELEKLKTELATQSDQRSQTFKQKIDLYKEVSNPLIELIVKASHAGTITKKDLEEFDKNRLSTTCLLGMFAPLNVFHEYNSIIDYIYDSVEGKAIWTFSEFRNRALKFLTAIRSDIGIYHDEVTYSGSR
jgi:hypothetical protein